jgi:DNA oxidative demethylase
VSEVRHTLEIRGVKVLKSFLDRGEQQSLLSVLRTVLKSAPLFSPETPYGHRMSVRMTSAGQFGWFSDRAGYRYVQRHPDGVSWPEIPPEILDIWDRSTGLERKPECCLINYYGAEAKMALHQDRDEADFSWPVVSISLGDDGLFRIGNTTRGGKTESIWLGSGDVVVMGGPARLTYHGVDRIRFGSSGLLPKGGRINLTLRVVS